jgi:hypothetical protein
VKILNRPAAVSSAKIFEHTQIPLWGEKKKNHPIHGKAIQRRSKSEDLPKYYSYEAFEE